MHVFVALTDKMNQICVDLQQTAVIRQSIIGKTKHCTFRVLIDEQEY